MDLLLRLLLAAIYLTWLPFALLARMLGRDPLQLKRPDTASYWLVREKASTRESYFSQASESEGRPAHREGAETGPRIGARPPLLCNLLRALARLHPRSAGTPRDTTDFSE